MTTQAQLDATAAKVGISSRAMLVDLTVRQWGASKHQKDVSKDVATQHGSDVEMGRFFKSLICKEALEKIRSIATAAATEHGKRTLPWLDGSGRGGSRILSSAGFFDYTAAMRKHQAAWDAAIKEFVSNYPQYILDAQGKLGTLYKEEDYPDVSEIADKFEIKFTILPVPTANDFRVALGQHETARIQEQIEQSTNEALQAAMQDVAKRVQNVVGHMANKLRDYTVTEDGAKEGIFRNSLVENVKDLVQLIPTFNLTSDPVLDDLAAKMQADLCTISPEVLRTSDSAREKVANAADDILKQMEGFVA